MDSCRQEKMRYNVAQLLMGPSGERRRYEFDEDIRHLDPDLEPDLPLTGRISLMRTSQGILVTGRLQTRLITTCRRCLEPSTIDVELELEEEFYPVIPVGNLPARKPEDPDVDEAVLIDEHNMLDLSEVIRQGLWLAAPEASLCRADCAGLCPACGGNRNLGECQCTEMPVDPRWAALQTILANESDS
jgi:uncharacterized protein